MTNEANAADLLELRFSYEDLVNPYREGRILRVESPTTPSGLELPEVVVFAFEQTDGTTRIERYGAGMFRSLVARGNTRPGLMGWRIVVSS